MLANMAENMTFASTTAELPAPDTAPVLSSSHEEAPTATQAAPAQPGQAELVAAQSGEQADRVTLEELSEDDLLVVVDVRGSTERLEKGRAHLDEVQLIVAFLVEATNQINEAKNWAPAVGSSDEEGPVSRQSYMGDSGVVEPRAIQTGKVKAFFQGDAVKLVMKNDEETVQAFNEVLTLAKLYFKNYGISAYHGKGSYDVDSPDKSYVTSGTDRPYLVGENIADIENAAKREWSVDNPVAIEVVERSWHLGQIEPYKIEVPNASEYVDGHIEGVMLKVNDFSEESINKIYHLLGKYCVDADAVVAKAMAADRANVELLTLKNPDGPSVEIILDQSRKNNFYNPDDPPKFVKSMDLIGDSASSTVVFSDDEVRTSFVAELEGLKQDGVIDEFAVSPVSGDILEVFGLRIANRTNKIIFAGTVLHEVSRGLKEKLGSVSRVPDITESPVLVPAS